MVKNLPAIQEIWIQSLGQEDSLEKGMTTHSSILPGESHGQRTISLSIDLHHFLFENSPFHLIACFYGFNSLLTNNGVRNLDFETSHFLTIISSFGVL